jgi:hypothetical protein
MSELHAIESALGRTARRRRMDRALRGLWNGLFAASIVWLLALIAYKVFPLPASSLLIGGGAGLVCVLIGAVIGGWRTHSIVETARWVDVKQDLKERLSTALEVAQSPKDAEWKTLLVHDAAAHAHGLDARRLLPLHLPRITRWALLVLALGACLGFVPEYRSKEFKQKQADAAVIKDTGKQIADLTRRTLENKPPVLEPTIKAMEKVEEMGQHLSKVSLTKADALKDLANVREKLEKEARELGKDLPPKSLEKAARESTAANAGQSLDAMQKQMDSLQKALGAAANNDPAKLDKFQKDLAKAQQMAANMPDKNSPEGKAAREQLAQTLANLAQQMRDAGAPMENLEDALKALQQGNIDQFVKDMEVAANDLQKLTEMSKQLQQLQQQAAGKMGKDLGEQLKNGQTDAAQQTLQKMIDQLKKGQLSKEQLDKILDEVAKAIDPAGEYGKVAEHLKDAVKKMQQCQNPGASDGEKAGAKTGAAQSLAAAAKELEKLAQQMQDAQQLAETMEMLERAQQAIATGQGWGAKPCGQCNGQGCAGCKGRGWNHGGSLSASGVGTWADETGWTYYPQNVPQTPVDNSGVQRPDQDARGLTDRDNALNDALKPTKVKGQINPGGQMPSVTLKGVSIKGQSKVQYEEAAGAAQSEAQNALNQDQVPRAYRGAVRDYFDDLKK